jgi:hypothetical protein
MRAKMGMLVVLAGDKVNTCIVTPSACDIQIGTTCRRTVRRASRFVLVGKARSAFTKMVLSLSYYVKNLFASSYGKDRPAFFIWHPKGTPSSEKKCV